MNSPVTIVTGVPRSGTSLLMQILAAAGHPLLADAERPPDEGNPRGYLEYAPVKNLARDSSWLPAARGHALKVIHALVPSLPPTETYRVLVLSRPWPEVVASQRALLARLGRPAPTLTDAALAALYETQFHGLVRHLAARPEASHLIVAHADLVRAPETVLPRLADFLPDPGLDWDRARSAVDPALYRNRSS
ncbi:MAG: sulfotransferase [Opitutaceae bacterium]|jgi:hypothetical protein|nr:sulfotransferase [Opitutaceae bacterium]